MSGLVLDRINGTTEMRLLLGDASVGVVLAVGRGEGKTWEAVLTTPERRMETSRGHATPYEAARWIGQALGIRVEGLR
jgi:hypothetical protein